MNRLLVWMTAFWMALGGVASAQEVVVVELFTSQGCSSCPPADKILGELAKRDDVIPLALHVDYWDYLGWRDEFASPEHTKRQRAYARAARARTIYTPQMIIGGRDHVIGSRPMEVSKFVQKHSQVKKPVRVRLQRDGDKVLILAEELATIPEAVVMVFTYTPEAVVKVRRGENAGRTLTYHNVVNSMTRLGNWDGNGAYRGSVSVANDMPVVVMVQARDGGVILGAARLR